MNSILKLTALVLVLTVALAHAADAPVPSRPLPLPLSPKQAEDRAAGSSADPTAAATRATLQGSITTARTGPAPFVKFTIADPTDARAPIPTRTVITDAEAPIAADAGKPPIPVLK